MDIEEPTLGEGCTRVVYKGTDCFDLPASVSPDGVVMTQWAPTVDELEKLLRGAPILLWQWTGGRRLQPQAVSVGDVIGGHMDEGLHPGKAGGANDESVTQSEATGAPGVCGPTGSAEPTERPATEHRPGREEPDAHDA